MDFGGMKLHIIRECEFKLDGGAMFGVVPKPMWNKLAPADEANRVKMACNLLLIQTEDKNVLVETGMGTRWSEKERERYALETLIDHARALESVGLKNEDVDVVVISHMHFDHIGGAVRETADGKLVPTYPGARYVVQRGEYDMAHTKNMRAKGSYRREDFEPLNQAGVLEIVDGDKEVAPGVWVRVTGGHTSHHQVVMFESGGRTGVYFADIIPTPAHLTPAWVMGYDHFPLETCDLKHSWLSRAAAEKWLVVFDHELATPWGYVSVDDKGKFAWSPLTPSAVSSI